ncbi:soyasapogenol B glucuronide galactosyltransferase-like [Ziziphus jujuba]|uniref:Soyasapogenol B glucuronide galactosyltransferase-like n=1 Tax=Ziziphus jujuba TaxID=326968 RepID=A0ABM3IU84_ZIZJJ|nr:soyasapogenol B glucuronide galactosyltransferase-like [Ziziphus jujuba]
MDSETDQLRIFFLPFISAGHMIPMVEEARLFAKHGVDVTVIITQANAALIHNNIDRDFRAGHRIRTHAIRFPSAEVGLPEGIESLSTITSMEMMGSIRQALKILQQTIEQLLYDGRPDCIVADMFYPWTLEVANKLGIPRLAFRGCSYFSLCAEYYVRVCEPHKHCSVDSNYDVVSLRGLPHKIDMLMSQLPDWSRKVTDFTDFMEVMTGAEEKSYGMLMNSFSELESDYEEYFKTTMGLRAWSVGPISLWVNKNVPDKAQRYIHNTNDNKEYEIVSWLNSKEDNSVLYVSFGSMTNLSVTQIKEIAYGLEASGHPFIWAVKKIESKELYCEEAFPEGFDERMSESKNGVIIKGWAPQVVILEHRAIGGMVTHCGWNSILECVNAGLPMITWPVFAEQFYNERFLIDVVGIGVSMGVKEWSDFGQEPKEVVSREEVEKAVKVLMGGGEEVNELRKRASKLRDAAKKAVEIGGSSHVNLIALIDELKSLKNIRNVCID